MPGSGALTRRSRSVALRSYEPEPLDELRVRGDAGVGGDDRTDERGGIVRREQWLELEIRRAEPRPLEVEHRDQPLAVPDDVVEVGVAVHHDAVARVRQRIDASEALDRLADLVDAPPIDVRELRRRFDESMRAVDRQRVEVGPDGVRRVGLGGACGDRRPDLRRWLPGVQGAEGVPELLAGGASSGGVEVGPGRPTAGCRGPSG